MPYISSFAFVKSLKAHKKFLEYCEEVESISLVQGETSSLE